MNYAKKCYKMLAINQNLCGSCNASWTVRVQRLVDIWVVLLCDSLNHLLDDHVAIYPNTLIKLSCTSDPFAFDNHGSDGCLGVDFGLNAIGAVGDDQCVGGFADWLFVGDVVGYWCVESRLARYFFIRDEFWA